MQAPGDVCVFRCVMAGFVDFDLVKSQLLGTLARDILKMYGRLTQVLKCQVIHVVA